MKGIMCIRPTINSTQANTHRYDKHSDDEQGRKAFEVVRHTTAFLLNSKELKLLLFSASRIVLTRSSTKGGCFPKGLFASKRLDPAALVVPGGGEALEHRPINSVKTSP